MANFLDSEAEKDEKKRKGIFVFSPQQIKFWAFALSEKKVLKYGKR